MAYKFAKLVSILERTKSESKSQQDEAMQLHEKDWFQY